MTGGRVRCIRKADDHSTVYILARLSTQPLRLCRHHLYATHSSLLLARLAWEVIQFIPPATNGGTDCCPPFMRQIETCVKEMHFCTFSKCSVGGHQLRNHPDYSSICVNGQREFLFFYRTAKNLQSPLFHRQSFHLQGSGRDPAALLPAKWRARLCIFSLPFFFKHAQQLWTF